MTLWKAYVYLALTLIATILALWFATLYAQEQPPRHDKYKDDAAAYCWNPETSGSMVAKRQRDPHAHQCSCHLTCQIGPDNDVIGDREDSSCELYCTRNRCTCHVETPCEMPGQAHNRLMDLDGPK